MKPSARTPSPEEVPTSFIGVDVGGTKIAAARVSFPEAQVLAHRLIPTRAHRGGDAVLQDVERLVGELSDEARGSGGQVQGLGVGVCELVGPDGVVLSAATVPWRGLPVRERLCKLAPAVIEADVRAAALAEARFGAGKGLRAFLYVTVGTGISCCLVLDGRPVRGHHGIAGTFASSPWPGGAPSERVASLEEIASGPALASRLRARGGEASTGQEVFEAAARGEPLAVDVVHSAGEALGSAVGWLVNVLDPGAVVVGGGLGLAGGPYWDAFVPAVRRQIWSDINRNIPLVPALLGVQAGVIGAATRAWLGPVDPPCPR
jgi:glucokinase